MLMYGSQRGRAEMSEGSGRREGALGTKRHQCSCPSLTPPRIPVIAGEFGTIRFQTNTKIILLRRHSSPVRK